MPQRQTCLTMAVLTCLLIALMLSGCARRLGAVHTPVATGVATGQVRLSWEGPTTKADGTPLTEVAGYRLHYGLDSRAYEFTQTVGPQTTSVVSGLEPGRTYYFAVTAYDTSGQESAFSDEVRMTVPSTVSSVPLLTHDPLMPGLASQFRVTGAHADEVVSFLFSLAGEGEGPCSPQLGGLCVDLLEPSVFGEATADASGTAMLTRTIPADIPAGRAIALQAVIQRGPGGTQSVKTNAMTAAVRE